MRRSGPATCLLIAAILAAAFSKGVAAGESKETGNVKFAARVEPERLEAGGQGVVVIVGTVRKDVHVFADKRFKIKPEPATGVTYGTPEKSKHLSWIDPDVPDEPASDVWFDRVEVRIPFTVGADASFPLKVGATITWSACDKDQCFSPETTKGAITAEVAGSGKAPAPAPPAPVAPAPAATPTVDVRTVLSGEDGTVTIRATATDVLVAFEPAAGRHVYAVGHPGPEHPIAVVGTPTEGIAWGALVTPEIASTEVSSPYEVRLPYLDARTPKGDLEIAVSWQACLSSEAGGVCHTPEGPHRFRVHREGAAATVSELLAEAPKPVVLPPPVPAPAAGPVAGSTPPAAAVPAKGLLFPVIGTRGESYVEQKWKQLGILILGPLFVIGILLAFTPCVLPIIPITVSIIGGGRTDLSRARLTVLLCFYVAGLALAFGSMGLIAAKAGGSFAAAFQSPVALWVIAGIFVVLAFGMLGIYELQPPAWMQRLQGGAKGGSVVGAFLFGALAALIASPCTGPVIAGLVVFTAQSGNVLLGFLMFFSLGLGMGSVFFAAGSLNLLMKPGPWMVWVRYGFGVMLIGLALYYLANSGKVGPTAQFGLGFGLAVLAAVGIARHLVKKEGEPTGTAATRGAQVAVLLVLVTGAVAFLTRAPSAGGSPEAGGAGAGPLTWTTVKSREALVAEVEKAKREGKATVVDVWAEWCTYCRQYDRDIEGNDSVKAGFQRLHRIRVDLTEDHPPWEEGVREGLDIPPNTQPFMVFLDAEGRIRRSLDVEDYMHASTTRELQARIQAVHKAP